MAIKSRHGNKNNYRENESASHLSNYWNNDLAIKTGSQVTPYGERNAWTTYVDVVIPPFEYQSGNLRLQVAGRAAVG